MKYATAAEMSPPINAATRFGPNAQILRLRLLAEPLLLLARLLQVFDLALEKGDLHLAFVLQIREGAINCCNGGIKGVEPFAEVLHLLGECRRELLQLVDLLAIRFASHVNSYSRPFFGGYDPSSSQEVAPAGEGVGTSR